MQVRVEITATHARSRCCCGGGQHPSAGRGRWRGGRRRTGTSPSPGPRWCLGCTLRDQGRPATAAIRGESRATASITAAHGPGPAIRRRRGGRSSGPAGLLLGRMPTAAGHVPCTSRRHPTERAVQDPWSPTAQSSGCQAPCGQLEHDDQHHGAVVRCARGRGHRSRPGASSSVMRVMTSCSSCGTCHERDHQDVEQRHGDRHDHGHAHRSHRQRLAHQAHHAERTQHSHGGHDQRPAGTVSTAHRHPSVSRCRAGDEQHETAVQQPDRDGRRRRCALSRRTRRSWSPRLSGGHRRLPGGQGPPRWPRRRSGRSRLRRRPRAGGAGGTHPTRGRPPRWPG